MVTYQVSKLKVEEVVSDVKLRFVKFSQVFLVVFRSLLFRVIIEIGLLLCVCVCVCVW